METLKYDAIATGHYAKTSNGNYLEDFNSNKDGKAYMKNNTKPYIYYCIFWTLIADLQLLMPKDKFKDQTFFLSGVKHETLRHCMFPLGDLLKPEVKKIAQTCGLVKLAAKRESTGICFVGQRDFKDFIEEVVAKHSF